MPGRDRSRSYIPVDRLRDAPLIFRWDDYAVYPDEETGCADSPCLCVSLLCLVAGLWLAFLETCL